MSGPKRNAQLLRSLLQREDWPYALASSLECAAGGARDGSDSAGDLIASLGEAAVLQRRRSTLARTAKGARSWNDWAMEVTDFCSEVARDAGYRAVASALAVSDLTDCRVETTVDLPAALVPGAFLASGAVFERGLYMAAARFTGPLCMRQSRVVRAAVFENAAFAGTADFSGAAFMDAAEFRNVGFAAAAEFRACSFAQDVWFRGSMFAADADFASADFGAAAGFGSCRFKGPADFAEATFHDHAGFDRARFSARASFAGARFEGITWFNDASFVAAPLFATARFAGALHFDRVCVPENFGEVHRQIEEIRSRLCIG